MKRHLWIRIGAVCGFSAVALGAFGAHALKPFLLAQDSLSTWETAAHYHLVHSLAILLPWSLSSRGWRPAPWFLAGIALFSGSLYLWSLTGLKWFVMVTPLGGLCLMIGWLALCFNGGRE